MKNLSIITILVLALIGCKKEDSVAPAAKTSVVGTTYPSSSLTVYLPTGYDVPWVTDSDSGVFKITINGTQKSSYSYNLKAGAGYALGLGELKSGDIIGIEYSIGVVSNGMVIPTYDTVQGRSWSDPYFGKFNHAEFTSSTSGSRKYIEFTDTTTVGERTATPTFYSIKLK